jgi:hypothetical protein
VETFGNRATVVFASEVETCKYHNADLHVNPVWYRMQTEQARAFLLSQFNERDKVYQDHQKQTLTLLIAAREAATDPFEKAALDSFFGD